MIYELRTYSLKPGTQPTVLGLFEAALPHRVERSPARGLLVHRDRSAQSDRPPLAL